MSKPIYILTHSYLVPDGSKELCSGMQRYIRELTTLITTQGLSCVVIQKAGTRFEKEPRPGVKVIGIPASPRAWADALFNARAHRFMPPNAAVIYALLELSYPRLRANSLAIQHGIWWDGEFPFWKRAVIRQVNMRVIQKSKMVVCVDTNFINWALETLGDYDLVTRKCRYIPNFVDANTFRANGAGHDRELPTVLFPRRCEEKRGAMLMLDAALRLWQRGGKFRLVFCGWGSRKEQVIAKAVAAGFGQLVSVFDVSFDEMPRVYRAADIVVIPTIRHEGTSLSCVEAMCMGKAVVATTIGGLPNLIVPGYNGELIAPIPEELAAALQRLLASPERRRVFGERARETAECLTVNRWSVSMWKAIQTLDVDV